MAPWSLLLVLLTLGPGIAFRGGYSVDPARYPFVACIETYHGTQRRFHTGSFVMQDRVITNTDVGPVSPRLLVRHTNCFHKDAMKVVEINEHYEFSVLHNSNMRFVLLRLQHGFPLDVVKPIAMGYMSFPVFMQPVYALAFSRTPMEPRPGYLKIYHIGAIAQCSEQETINYFNDSNVCYPGDQTQGTDYWDFGVYGHPLVYDDVEEGRAFMVGMMRNLYYEGYAMTAYTTLRYAGPFLRALLPGVHVRHIPAQGSVVRRAPRLRSAARGALPRALLVAGLPLYIMLNYECVQ